MQFRPFAVARRFARRLQLRTYVEWRRYCRGDLRRLGKRPKDIPSNPNTTYEGEGWVGWPDWLGSAEGSE